MCMCACIYFWGRGRERVRGVGITVFRNEDEKTVPISDLLEQWETVAGPDPRSHMTGTG